MTWTVACFCGNVYCAPPNRCEACGNTPEGVAFGNASTPQTPRTPPTRTASLTASMRPVMRGGFGENPEKNTAALSPFRV